MLEMVWKWKHCDSGIRSEDAALTSPNQNRPDQKRPEQNRPDSRWVLWHVLSTPTTTWNTQTGTRSPTQTYFSLSMPKKKTARWKNETFSAAWIVFFFLSFYFYLFPEKYKGMLYLLQWMKQREEVGKYILLWSLSKGTVLRGLLLGNCDLYEHTYFTDCKS